MVTVFSRCSERTGAGAPRQRQACDRQQRDVASPSQPSSVADLSFRTSLPSFTFHSRSFCRSLEKPTCTGDIADQVTREATPQRAEGGLILGRTPGDEHGLGATPDILEGYGHGPLRELGFQGDAVRVKKRPPISPTAPCAATVVSMSVSRKLPSNRVVDVETAPTPKSIMSAVRPASSAREMNESFFSRCHGRRYRHIAGPADESSWPATVQRIVRACTRYRSGS